MVDLYGTCHLLGDLKAISLILVYKQKPKKKNKKNSKKTQQQNLPKLPSLVEDMVLKE